MNEGEVAIRVVLNEGPLDKKLRKLKSRLEREQLDLGVKRTKYDETIEELNDLKLILEITKRKNDELNESLAKSKAKLEDIQSKDNISTKEFQMIGTMESEIKNLEA